jgi:hypothetical protein
MPDLDREAGYIFLHRQVLSSAVWQSINDWRLAETLLLMANWKPGVFQSRSGEVIQVGRGELITSVQSLQEASGLSRQNIRTALDHLEKAEFLTRQVTKHWQHVKLVNYGRYQSPEILANQQTNQDLTKTQPRYKKGKKEKTTTSPEAAKLTDLLAELLTSNGVKRLPEREKGAQDADKLLRLDKRALDEAEAVLRWAQSDSFWKANIMSMGKFRNQYDRLRLRMHEDAAKAGGNNGGQKNGAEHLYS